MRKIEERYREALATIPAPGGGCHVALLGVANLGIMAGLDDNTMLAEIRASVPAGGAKFRIRKSEKQSRGRVKTPLRWIRPFRAPARFHRRAGHLRNIWPKRSGMRNRPPRFKSA